MEIHLDGSAPFCPLRSFLLFRTLPGFIGRSKSRQEQPKPLVEMYICTYKSTKEKDFATKNDGL